MRFLADMCVDVRIVKWLEQNGHDATHLRDQGLHRMPNGEIFEKAIREDRIVITFDHEGKGKPRVAGTALKL